MKVIVTAGFRCPPVILPLKQIPKKRAMGMKELDEGLGV